MKAELTYPVVIYPAQEGGYVAEVPALKGCLAQGETPAECLRELKKVQSLWLESAKRNKEKVPTPAQVLLLLERGHHRARHLHLPRPVFILRMCPRN